MELLENDPRLAAEVFDALMDTGIPANIVGYHYLKEILPMAVVNPEAVLKARQNLYTPMAERALVSASSVQSAIRNAIKIGWDRADLETLELYFGYKVKNAKMLPSTSEYIATVSERIRIRLGSKNQVASSACEDEVLDDKITRLFYNLQLLDYDEGCLYLKYAIKVAIQNNMASAKLVPGIYQIVADGYLTTPSHVKYILGRCIDIMWNAQALEAIQVLFGSTISPARGKPTVGEFLAAAVEGIRLELQHEANND